MSQNEWVIVGAAAGGVAVYFLWHASQKNKVPAGAPPVLYSSGTGAGANTPGSAIAQFGGAAIGQLGKQAGAWLGDEISDLFS